MLPILNRIKSWWTNADPRQRVVTLGGIGALLLLLVGTMYFATRPTYTVLLENLSETERADAVEALKGMSIPVQLSRRGVVEVPEGQADEARMGLAKAGKLPSGPNHLGLADLTKIGPMVSPGVEAETLKGILEGRISDTLEKMEGVAAARVLITLPRETVFQDEKETPTASVTLTEKSEGMLTPTNGRMIANLVCSAVQGMKPDGVYVGTSGLAVLWDGHNADLPSSKGDLDAKTARMWEAKIQSALDGTLGAGNSRVIVRADVDTAKKTTKITEESPTATPTASLTVSEEMANSKGNPRGVGGMDPNGGAAPATPPADGKEGATYKKKGKDEKFGNNRTETTIEGGEGGLKALAITVAVNSEKVDDVAGVEGLVNGVMAADIEKDAAGVAKPNQKFSVKVQPIKFSNAAALAAKEAEDKRAGAARTQQLLSLLPIAAILVVAFLVAKGIGKISQAALPAPAEEPAAMLVADETLVEETPALPEGAEGEFGAIEQYMDEIAAMPAPGSAPALEGFPTRVDASLDSLKQMAAERPEMVATLIKSMLLGEQA